MNGVTGKFYPLLYLYVGGPDLTFNIALPTADSIDFGHGIKTGPITLTIDTKKFALSLSASVTYTPLSGGGPLYFNVDLELDRLGASVSADATMEWNNPLDISRELTVKEVALKIGIIYEQFLTTGTPSTVGVLGKFQVGEETDEIALVFGDNPTGK